MKRDVFNALADPTRRSILISLIGESLNVNALAENFDITRQAVSLHINYMQECGVISIKKDGRERQCSLKADSLSEVAEWLDPFRKMWTGKLQQLGKVIEEMNAAPQKKI